MESQRVVAHENIDSIHTRVIEKHKIFIGIRSHQIEFSETIA